MHFKFWPVALLVLAIFLSLSVSAASPNFTFNDPGFATTWNRVDGPVQAGTGAGRGYIWGPALPQAASMATERYNGQLRKVQYFDKARMEVNDPAANPASLFYVTTGLLVKELVTGQRQDGNTTFTALSPSTIQVVGDSNEAGQNSLAPTYASFKGVGSFANQTTPAAAGSVISNQIDKTGQISPITVTEAQVLGSYDTATGHNIAAVFDHFTEAVGPVMDGTKLTNQPIFFNNPLYVLGHPLTEPYWTRAVVDGVERDVLVQLFERRVLTYTPANADPYKVEMGNVGQHYFQWRYVQNVATPAPTPTPVLVVHPVPQASTPVTPTVFTGKGIVQEQNFFSPILSMSVPYAIYLPPGYAASQKHYPVLYALHGYSGDIHEWENLGLLGRADDLINTGVIQPMIIVLPWGNTDYWLNHSDNGPRWGDYTVYDVVNFIDANYRTIPDRDHRAIGGLSMGGHGALQNGFNHPEIFSIVGAHSPTLRTLDQNPGYFGDAAYFVTIDPVSLARTKDLSNLKIWIDIGASDIWLPEATVLHQVLTDRNIPHSWETPPGDHSGDYWFPHIADYLQFYSSSFPSP